MDDLIMWVVIVFVMLLTSRILEALRKPILAKIVRGTLLLLFAAYCFVLIKPFLFL